jgi:hypothetical protein
VCNIYQETFLGKFKYFHLNTTTGGPYDCVKLLCWNLGNSSGTRKGKKLSMDTRGFLTASSILFLCSQCGDKYNILLSHPSPRIWMCYDVQEPKCVNLNAYWYNGHVQNSRSMNTEGYFPGDKAAGVWSNPLTHPKLIMHGTLILLSHHGVALSYRNNFTFVLNVLY